MDDLDRFMMTNAPVRRRRDAFAFKATPDERYIPHSIEAEQQLLGALMTKNDFIHEVHPIVSEEHFYDPVHAALFAVISKRCLEGSKADPVTLKPVMEMHKGLQELGGQSYLVNLLRGAVSTFAAKDYAKTIYDTAVRREIIQLGREIEDQAAAADGTAPEAAELVEQTERRLFDIVESGGANRGFVPFVSAATEAVRQANEAYRSGDGMVGLPTGLKALDNLVGGLQKSDLIILGGRPGMGKTALATNIAFHVAGRPVDPHCVGFFSLEMSAVQLSTRILASRSGVSVLDIRRGRVGEGGVRKFISAVQELEDAALHIDDTGAIPLPQLAARARRLKRRSGLDLIIVDYLQLVRPGETRRNRNRNDEVGEITQGLKALAKDLNVPVLALSQLSREVEKRDNKRPGLSDLRDSGSIEQDADIVLFAFREEYYRKQEEPEQEDADAYDKWLKDCERLAGQAEVIVAKHRHGETGTARLHFSGERTEFTDREYRDYQREASPKKGPVKEKPEGYRDPTGDDEDAQNF